MFSRRRRDEELDEEIRAHLAMATRDRMERGEEPRAAELAARREFGNRTLIQEVTREMWGWNSLERLWQDARYALRGMRRSPGFTGVAVVSLAMGIGANTAIFSLVNTVVLRMLPVQHPEQLVELLLKYPDQARDNGWSWASYEHFRDHNHVFSALTGMSRNNLLNVRTAGSEPEIMTGEYVPGNYFPVLGLKPAIGRLIGPRDAPASAAVVSWSYWKKRFHLDPAILGQRIVVQDKAATIVGVTPREFFGVLVGSRTDVWLPRSAEMALQLFGRLRPGVTLQQARAEMSVLYRFTMEEHARSAPASALRQTGRAGETRLGRLFGRGLVAAQVASSIVLLSAAGLFVGYLSHLKHLDLGFQREGVLLVTLDPARSGYQRGQLAHPYQELLARLESIPGVRSASISAASPIQGAGAGSMVTAEGHRERPEDRRRVGLNWVAPKYFATLGTPLLAGRDFQFEDQGRPRVAIVNQSMARYYFGRANPIGKHVTRDGDVKPYEIVGVVGDAKYLEIREGPGRTMYFNMFQEGRIFSQFAVRASVEPASLVGEVRRAVRDVLKTVPVTRVITLADQVEASIVPERLIATLSGLFGVLGALIAAIGLYGLLAYTVARRTNEIGIRMALGAARSTMAGMVLGEALGMSCGGLLIGVPIAFWGQRFAASLIPDLPVKSVFPVALGAVIMIALALLAAYVPARRATRVDPVEALRYE